jgi:diguanylate cyclase (GGDEF)-like protein/PAS domain S-box-containing protein
MTGEMIMFRTVREKLIISFLLVAMVPLLLLGFSTYLQMANSLKTEMIFTSSNQMIQLDHLITHMLKGIKEDNQMLSTHPVVTQGESAAPIYADAQVDIPISYQEPGDNIDHRIFAEFERYAKYHMDVAYVYMGTESGGYIQWPLTEVRKAGYDPRKRSWYQQSIKNPDQIMISEPYQSFLGDNFIISTTNPIRDENGKIIGVMGIDVSLQQLSRIIEDCNIGNSSYVFMFTKEGIILAHPDKGMHFQNISALAMEEARSLDENSGKMSFSDFYKLLHEPEGFLETTINGKKVFVNFKTSSATGWKIATVIDESVLITKNQHVALVTSVIILLLILFTFGGTSFITLYLTQPLDQVVRHLQSITNGDLALSISGALLKRKDEIGEVAQAVDIMQKSRYQIETQLTSSNEELAILYEQLASTEEELRAQFDELWDKQKIIEKSEERYRLATEGANDAIWDWDIHTGEVVISTRLLNKLGWSDEENKNLYLSWWKNIHPEDQLQAREKLEEHLAGKTEEYLWEYRVKGQAGKYLWILTRGKALFDAQGIAVRMAGSFTDITANKMRDLQIQHMAYYDSLTNLPSRASIVECLTSELGKKEASGAILFIDLDNFKFVNDSFGYENGDRLLVQVAKRLQQIAGRHFVARLGGDEFIMMVKGITDCTTIEKLAQCITQAIDQPFTGDMDSFMVTSSIGIALYPRDGNKPDEIMRSADLALHQAKKEGKRCYAWFQEKLEHEMLEKLYIEQGLKEAIRKEEFVLHYQPIVDLHSGQIVGLEALIRWQRPEYDLVFPDEFMSVAEEGGLIVPMGQWVLKTACLFGKELRDSGREICIAVNVSVKELLQNDFVEQVARILDETGFPSSCLELEIVETLLIDKFEVAVPKLHHLRAMGVQISLDDFGTGYSSLSYLKELPLDIVKIDRSFVSGAMKKNTHVAIIETIIELCHRLQLKVVAEGVETEGQRFFLRKKKCDKIQGYLISKAIEKEKVWDILQKK